MADSNDRKPTPPQREAAQIVLNRFLKENNILLGLSDPVIEFTKLGAMLLHPPKIMAIYGDERSPVQAQPTAPIVN